MSCIYSMSLTLNSHLVYPAFKFFYIKHFVCVLSNFSHVWLFVALCTVALQTLLSMGFSRQEHWSGLPFPPPGDRTHSCLRLPHCRQILHPLSHLGSPFCDVAAPFPLNWIYMLGNRRGCWTTLLRSCPAQRLAFPDRSRCLIWMTIWKHPSWVRIHTHTNTHIQLFFLILRTTAQINQYTFFKWWYINI